MKILIKNPKGKIEKYFLKMRYIFSVIQNIKYM